MRLYLEKLSMIGTIVILQIMTEAHGGCPVRCVCTENAVTCVSKNLEYVPYFESLENNPAIIDLSGNSISNIDIDDFSFDKSDQVIELYLNHTELTMIEESSFEELENLQGLYLNDNLLTSLPEDFLIYNENVILLDLSNNYFDVMPTIKSDSLEIVTVANSVISRIPNDALDYLPNLRILLLQQNNLKSINPTIFDHTSNLLFVRIAYNPWFCNCKTIKLFDYLTKKKLVELTEVVQCQTQDKTFVDIYTEEGALPEFRRQCSSSEDNADAWKTEFSFKTSEEGETEESEVVSEVVFSSEYYDDDAEDDDVIDVEEVYYMNFFAILLLCFATALSLIVGAIVGSCLTYKYMTRSVKQMDSTDSTKELMFHFS